MTSLSSLSKKYIDEINHYGAHNYHPLDVVISHGRGEWLWDIDGNKYLDMLSAYSALSHGHCHPKIQKKLVEQSSRVTLASRAFYNDQFGLWLKKLTDFCKMEMALPMNTGAEAVETAIKIARKWGYVKKNIPKDKAEMIVCDHNFHGRTTTIVGFSSEPQYRDLFGPHSGGFVSVKYGDISSLKNAITENTVGFLFEPIQGEAGIIVPPEGYLKDIYEICKKNNILCIADEIQTGLGRTGKLFACMYENIQPDLMILGKALGGGFYPISAVVGSKEIMEILQPGDHGSTFGGNSLACAVSQTALDVLIEENLSDRAFNLGEKFRKELSTLSKKVVKEVRGKGLLNAIEIHPTAGEGHFYTELLMKNGILAKETHNTTIRFAPPLVIEESSLNFAIQIILDVFSKTQSEHQKLDKKID